MGSVGKWDLKSAGDGSFRASVFYMGESYITSEAIAHEIGHNLGLPHASSVPCVPASLVDPVDCCGSWDEAGDAGDTMGSITGFQHFSSVFKSLSFWFDPAQVFDVADSGEYTLDQLELPSNGIKALRIPAGKDSSGQEAYYWVEYRTTGTFDQEQAVQVRFQPVAAFNGSSMTNNTLRFKGPAFGGSISGKVVSESDGSPVPQQAYVYLYDTAWRSIRSAYTDGAGHYAFKGLAAGSYYLRTSNNVGLIDEYYNNARSQKSASLLTLTQDQTIDNADFALATGSILSGVINRESDGTSVPNAYVYAYDSSWAYIRGIGADSSGRYALTGLPAGKYYLEAYSSAGYGYLTTCYINTLNRATATSVSLNPGERLNDIDISLFPGGAISGKVLQASDNAAIQNVWVNAYDNAWKSIKSAVTSSDGRYMIKGLPSGSYFVGALNSLGYINEYYREVTDRSAATAIQVVQDSETGSIDFTLAKAGTASTEAHNHNSSGYWARQAPQGIDEAAGEQNHSASGDPVALPDLTADLGFSSSAEGRIHPAKAQSLTLPSAIPAIQSGNPVVSLSDVTSTAPFLDPYRGVKIELLESTGTGAEARAKLKISLSKLRIDVGHTINFDQIAIGGRQAKELTITNETPAAVMMGMLCVQGRSDENFSVTRDECSGINLTPGATCKSEVSFSPVRYSGTAEGEFAVLKIPTSDSLHSAASVDLRGKTLAADLTLYGYQGANFVVGRNGIYEFDVVNYGTVSSSDVITITDKLPTGLRYVSNSIGWSCSVAGQDVSCSRALVLRPNYGTVLDLTVAVTAEAAPTCVNKATVSNSSDANPDNNFSILTTMVDLGSGEASYGPILLKEDGTFTGFAFLNAGTATAALSITALDKTGAALQYDGMTNPATLVLKPGAQFPVMDDQLWAFPPGEKAKMGWFRVDSLIQRVLGFTLAFDGMLQVLDGATFSRSPAGTVVLPDVVTEGFTRIHVLNPGTADVNLTIGLVAADGTPRPTAARKLGPNASLAETVQELFGGVSASTSDYLRVTANGDIVAMECLGVADQWIRALGAQDAGGGAQVLYASQYAVGGPYWTTSISIVNLDSSPAQLRARLINDDGNQIGQTLLMPIKANGKVLLSEQNLFLEAGDTLTQGYVEITSDGARLAGSVTFGDKQGRISASLPLQPAAHKEFVYGHAASNATWYTGIALVNPNDSDITATLQLYDKSGQLSASKTEVMGAKRRKIQLLNGFFPEATGADITSGYIRVSAGSPLVGFALFGTRNDTVLAAIPPQAIR